VYGDLNTIALRKRGSRYEPQHPHVLAHGIDESCPLSFHSPYGCSKGAADQYVLDYARSYGMPNVVFRMSCIYGPHQCGTEDQGWVAHFLLQAIAGRPITLYGDGMQVRDVLFVEDLVDAMVAAQQNAPRIAGQPFNIGGGPRNVVSLIELLAIIGELERQAPGVRFDDWRAGDQRYYVSDTRALQLQPAGCRESACAKESADYINGCSKTTSRFVRRCIEVWLEVCARKPELVLRR
jgi:CDP-paratose 2-epimerase